MAFHLKPTDEDETAPTQHSVAPLRACGCPNTGPFSLLLSLIIDSNCSLNLRPQIFYLIRWFTMATNWDFRKVSIYGGMRLALQSQEAVRVRVCVCWIFIRHCLQEYLSSTVPPFNYILIKYLHLGASEEVAGSNSGAWCWWGARGVFGRRRCAMQVPGNI